MTEEEVYGILKKARGKVKLLAQCLFFLGLRVSEALSLKKKDVIYGPRLSFLVMRKGQKRREVLTGRMVSKKDLASNIQDGGHRDILKRHHIGWDMHFAVLVSKKDAM